MAAKTQARASRWRMGEAYRIRPSVGQPLDPRVEPRLHVRTLLLAQLLPRKHVERRPGRLQSRGFVARGLERLGQRVERVGRRGVEGDVAAQDGDGFRVLLLAQQSIAEAVKLGLAKRRGFRIP